MPHTTKRQSRSQARNHPEALNLRRKVIAAMWGDENVSEGTPCAEQPLVAGVCGCASAGLILEFMKGRGTCPFGAPWDCPGRRLD